MPFLLGVSLLLLLCRQLLRIGGGCALWWSPWRISLWLDLITWEMYLSLLQRATDGIALAETLFIILVMVLIPVVSRVSPENIEALLGGIVAAKC